MSEPFAHPMAQPSVLLVEDEPRYREMLLDAVSEMGFEAKGVGSAEQALRALAQQSFGIIVLDLNLPAMGGMEFLETIRRQHPQEEVVILTGFGDLAAAKKAMRLDVVDFITKPCQLDELEMSLSRACARRRRAVSKLVAGDAAASEPLSAAPLEEIERAHILASMKKHHGNRRAVATELGISLRTLYNRLRDYKRLKIYGPGTPGESAEEEQVEAKGKTAGE